jgi:hypothetical protein
MLHLPISRNWLFSMTAQRLYFACACLALALFATVIGVNVAMSVAGTGRLNFPAASLVRALLFPEIAGSAMLWVAMWYFWFSFDRSHYLKKAIWFALLFFLAGTVPYYFVVYRRFVSTEAD